MNKKAYDSRYQRMTANLLFVELDCAESLAIIGQEEYNIYNFNFLIILATYFNIVQFFM